MLIGLVLVGFILVLLFGGVRLGTRSWDSGEEKITALTQKGVVLGFVRNMLERCFPMRWMLEGESFVAFEGEADSISFVGPMPAHQGGAGHHLIRMKVVKEGGRNDLVIRWRGVWPLGQGFSLLDEGESSTLLKNIKNVEFAYFGRETMQSEPVWHVQWLRGKALPRLIRIRIIPENGEHWPELVIAPALDNDADSTNAGDKACILC